ncbi:hypothetical protein RUM43_001040 [Polyplax serrata]|uniref:FOXO protein transactivation domain-containing protein n=1 Tax=Polyplax serrata TaxID=468196 RepID=A0AAN8SH16_POLSC
MRVQNEGTGKSSWWMINPDAKPGKSSRRRATSMETSKFEKRRGRVKKKVETLRNGLIPADATPSPSSSVSEGLDMFPDSPLHSNTGFQLSPDFRPRASSNASSCGRLSPIPFSESEWNSPTSYPSSYVSEQLAGSLAEDMKLHHEAFITGGFTNSGGPPPPPPPYQAPFDGFGARIGHAPTPYGISHCPVHRVQGCSCALSQCTGESLSPAGLSPSCLQNESSPDPMSGTQTSYIRRGSLGAPRLRNTPSTMMGQLMGALNNSAVLDDLNLNIETFHGGFDCNVDEVIKHELSMDGSLDFNFSHNQTSLTGGQTVADSNSGQPGSNYSTTGVTVEPNAPHAVQPDVEIRRLYSFRLPPRGLTLEEWEQTFWPCCVQIRLRMAPITFSSDKKRFPGWEEKRQTDRQAGRQAGAFGWARDESLRGSEGLDLKERRHENRKGKRKDEDAGENEKPPI